MGRRPIWGIHSLNPLSSLGLYVSNGLVEPPMAQSIPSVPTLPGHLSYICHVTCQRRPQGIFLGKSPGDEVGYLSGWWGICIVNVIFFLTVITTSG